MSVASSPGHSQILSRFFLHSCEIKSGSDLHGDEAIMSARFHSIPATITLTHADSTMNATFEHFEMNTNNAYATLNTAVIATTRDRAYMTTEQTVSATQNVLDEQVLPGTDGYDYIIV